MAGYGKDLFRGLPYPLPALDDRLKERQTYGMSGHKVPSVLIRTTKSETAVHHAWRSLLANKQSFYKRFT